MSRAKLERQGYAIPLLIGGATTSKAHTAVKIQPVYQSEAPFAQQMPPRRLVSLPNLVNGVSVYSPADRDEPTVDKRGKTQKTPARSMKRGIVVLVGKFQLETGFG